VTQKVKRPESNNGSRRWLPHTAFAAQLALSVTSKAAAAAI
jgi:hypothetical protein